jgi:uncharacterized membrane protein YfcA
VQLDVSAAGFIVGIVIGLTGMGGGALMTPILVLGFGIQPLAAVSSDLVAAVVMKPIGGGIHWRRGTVHGGLVRWLAAGSVPGAFGGAYLVSHIGDDINDPLQTTLGVVLLVAAGALILRAWFSRHHQGTLEGTAAQRVPVRRLPTLIVGILGGLVVGVTSVGSGSLMIVALMMLYPTLAARELVGTDLVQAIPLVSAAALGHVLWGDLQLDLTGSLLIGCIPGVIIGAHISSRANDAAIRPLLAAVLVLTGAKLLGASNELLGVLAGVAAIVVAPIVWRTFKASRTAREAAPSSSARDAAPSSIPRQGPH